MKNDLITIIVPLYNNEENITKCIDSILNQTYQNIELICIDDGSTDNSLDVLNKYASNEKVVIVSRENKGTLLTRKEAIEKANGKYIMFVDSDDFIEEDVVESAYNILINENVDMVRFGIKKDINEKTYIIKQHYSEKTIVYKNEFREKVYPIYLEKYDYSSMCALIIKSDIIKKINIDKNYIMGEDLYINLKLLQYLDSICFVEKPYYHYTFNINGTCNNLDINRIKRSIQDTKEIMYTYFDYLKIWGMNTQENIDKVSIRLFFEVQTHFHKLFKVNNITKKQILTIINEVYNSKELETARSKININTIKLPFVIRLLLKKDYTLYFFIIYFNYITKNIFRKIINIGRKK